MGKTENGHLSPYSRTGLSKKSTTLIQSGKRIIECANKQTKAPLVDMMMNNILASEEMTQRDED